MPHRQFICLVLLPPLGRPLNLFCLGDLVFLSLPSTPVLTTIVRPLPRLGLIACSTLAGFSLSGRLTSPIFL